jgi:hypothetical protein
MSGAANVFTQHLNGTGQRTPGWAPNGDSLTNLYCFRLAPSIAPDGAGGAFVTWADNRCAPQNDIYAQRVDANGSPQWGANGIPICQALRDKQFPFVVADGTGGAIIAWQDERHFPDAIWAQRLTSTGALAPGWPVDGVLVASTNGKQSAFDLLPDGSGGAFVVWQDDLEDSNAVDIRAQHLASSGSWTWGAAGVGVCVAPDSQRAPVAVLDGAGGLLVSWKDHRSGIDRIYAQRLNASGVAQWTADGVPVSDAAGAETHPAIAADGTGGVIVAWQDQRGADLDVYAQHLGANGARAGGWASGGVALVAAPGDQSFPAAVSDSAGGAYVAWRDARSGGPHVYGVRVSGAGAIPSGWTANGSPLAIAAASQGAPVLIQDGAGGAYAAWEDTRACATTGTDVYALRLLSGGPSRGVVKNLHGTPIAGQTFLVWNAPGGVGWTYRIYASSQPITQSADLASATLLGAVGDSTWCDRRYYSITGSPQGFVVDSLSPPLSSASGMFVVTPVTAGTRYYAVTLQLGDCAEDVAITPGANSLLTSVPETVAAPTPIYQHPAQFPGGPPCDVYTLWTTNQATAQVAAMASRPSLPFDCAVVHGGTAPWNTLMLALHPHDSNFLSATGSGSGYNGEWLLTLDDPVATDDINTFWYGYQENYDPTLWVNPVPTSGTVREYTMQRVLYTLRWAERRFAVDTTRVYANGYSMAGIGSIFLAMRHPEMIAAILAIVPKFDMSFLTDPDTLTEFDPRQALRNSADRLWGSVGSNLPTDEGLPVYTALNDGAMLPRLGSRAFPPLIAFNGKNDEVVGWAEKIPFYQAMTQARAGGCLYWDQRDHLSNNTGHWSAMQPAYALNRYRTNRSFPAFSHCSADGDPGDGHATSGDSVGVVNAWVDWDSTFVDQRMAWETTLRTRDLQCISGTAVGPDSVVVDVTPRRLQNFAVAAGNQYAYSVTRLSDGAVVQSGTVSADTIPLVTIPTVKVYRAGSKLHLDNLGPVGVPTPAPPAPPRRLELVPSSNPVRREGGVTLLAPRAGIAVVRLFDLAGREVRRLHDGPVREGRTLLNLDASRLPPGVYLMQARLNGQGTTARIVILR